MSSQGVESDECAHRQDSQKFVLETERFQIRFYRSSSVLASVLLRLCRCDLVVESLGLLEGLVLLLGFLLLQFAVCGNGDVNSPRHPALLTEFFLIIIGRYVHLKA